MGSSRVGYDFLRESLGLKVFALSRPAVVMAVSRMELRADRLAVPRAVAPQGGLLDHLLFALKHEGTNLQILSQVLPLIDPDELTEAVRNAPSSAFVRKACYLWEQMLNRVLPINPVPGGSYVDVFDRARYFTNQAGPKNARWRVCFNGLGSLDYCVTVERTPEITALIADPIMARMNGVIAHLDAETVKWAMEWAYLGETEGSYAIEGERPAQNKAEAFVATLHEAHQRRPLDEDYLVELQNTVVTDPWGHETQFRVQQNWLRRGGRGALSVRYVPPAPELALSLMGELMRFANQPPLDLDPLITASIVSFGFVFLHPFMDGNGRLSRFLFHHALCRAGVLTPGVLLPVSVAMHRHEADYLVALTSFSGLARQLWQVTQVSEAEFQCEFKGPEAIYRYWDATPCVEFGLRMAQEAVDADLVQEAKFLELFDSVYRTVSAQYEVRSNDLAALILVCYKNGGVISKGKRDSYLAKLNPQTAGALMDAIESAMGRL